MQTRLSQVLTVLVIDDDPDIVTILSIMLKQAGHAALSASDGIRGLEAAKACRPDIVILDVNLPGQSGHAVCRQLREFDSSVGIIMLSSLTNTEDKVLALELGADDYLGKPISESEFLARVAMIHRRRGVDRSTTLRIGKLWLDLANHLVTYDARPVALTPTEFRLLTVFARQPGRVFDRDTLCRAIYDSNDCATTGSGSIDIHVRNMRKKVSSETAVIRSVHGVGYRLDVSSLEAPLAKAVF